MECLNTSTNPDDNKVYFYVYLDETGTFKPNSTRSAVAGYALQATRCKRTDSTDSTDSTNGISINQALCDKLIQIISSDSTSGFYYFHCGANSSIANRPIVQTSTLKKLWEAIPVDNENYFIEQFKKNGKNIYVKVTGKEAIFFKAPQHATPLYSAAPKLTAVLDASDCYLQTLSEGLVSFFLAKTQKHPSAPIRLEIFICQRQLATPEIDDSFNTKFGNIELPNYIISIINAANKFIPDQETRDHFLHSIKFRVKLPDSDFIKSEGSYEDIRHLFEINNSIREFQKIITAAKENNNALTEASDNFLKSQASLATTEFKTLLANSISPKLKNITQAHNKFITCLEGYEQVDSLSIQFDNIKIVQQNTNALKKAVEEQTSNPKATESMPLLLADYIANSLYNANKCWNNTYETNKYYECLERLPLCEYSSDTSVSEQASDQETTQLEYLSSLLNDTPDLYQLIKTLCFDSSYIPLWSTRSSAIINLVNKAQSIFESSSYPQEKLLNILLEDLKPRCLQHHLASENLGIIENLTKIFGNIEELRNSGKTYRVPFALELLILKFQCLSSINDAERLSEVNQQLHNEFYYKKADKKSGKTTECLKHIDKPIYEPRFSEMHTLYTLICANILYDNSNPAYKAQLDQCISAINNDVNPEYGKVFNTKLLYVINDKLKQDHYLSPHLKKLYSDSPPPLDLGKTHLNHLMKSIFVKGIIKDLRTKGITETSLVSFGLNQTTAKNISEQINTYLQKYTSINICKESPEWRAIQQIISNAELKCTSNKNNKECPIMDYLENFVRVQIYIRSYHLLEGIDLANTALYHFKNRYPKDKARTYQVLSTTFIKDYPAIALLLLYKSIFLTEVGSEYDNLVNNLLNIRNNVPFPISSSLLEIDNSNFIKILKFLSGKDCKTSTNGNSIDSVAFTQEYINDLSKHLHQINTDIQGNYLQHILQAICNHIFKDSTLDPNYIYHFNILLQTLQFEQIRKQFTIPYTPIHWKTPGSYPQCLTYRYIVQLWEIDDEWTQNTFSFDFIESNKSNYSTLDLQLLEEAQQLLTYPNCPKSFLWTSIRLSLLAEMLILTTTYYEIDGQKLSKLKDVFNHCFEDYKNYIYKFSSISPYKERLSKKQLMNKFDYFGDIYNTVQSDNHLSSICKNDTNPISKYDLQKLIDLLPY